MFKKQAAMLTIGAEAASLKELRAIIMDILRAKVDQSTMVAALETIQKTTNVSNTVVSGCSFTHRD